MDGNLFVYVEWFPVVHVASLHGYLPEKMSQKKALKKKRKKERKVARKSDTWME